MSIRATAIAAPGVMPDERSIDLLWQAFDTEGGTILPQQIGRADWKPEQELIGTLIVNTIKECFTPEEATLERVRAYQRWLDQRRALAWIFARGDHVFGFEWCCEHVNVDAQWVRRLLRKRLPRAVDIDEHLQDPENVPAPEPPRWILPRQSQGRRAY